MRALCVHNRADAVDTAPVLDALSNPYRFRPEHAKTTKKPRRRRAFVAPDAHLSVMEIKWRLVPDMAGIVLMRRAFIAESN
jgi:hypothetical protein